MIKKSNIRGIMIADGTMDEAVGFISDKLSSGESVSIFTPNAEIAYRALKDASLMTILNACDMAVPDGIGIVKASRILGCPLREKVAGVDLGLRIADLAEKCGYNVYLYGGMPGIAEKAAEELTKRFPNISISGTSHGYRNDKSTLIEDINASGAQILYVCLGSPMQEKWINENKDHLPNVRLLIGLGGSLDIYAGKAKRAPKVFIRLGLEWFYRLISDPKRIVRMAALPRFYFGTWLYRFRQ